MSEEKGESGMERRIAERVELEVEVRWTRLEQKQADALLTKGGYSEIFAFSDLKDVATEEVLERQAYTQNLSVTGIKLVGDLRLKDGAALKEGWELLVDIVVPDVKPIRALAVVVWVSPPNADPRQAGLFFKAINKDDIARVAHLQAQVQRSKDEPAS
jgi:PilZ domain